jgi:hypothetical protein
MGQGMQGGLEHPGGRQPLHGGRPAGVAVRDPVGRPDELAMAHCLSTFASVDL